MQPSIRAVHNAETHDAKTHDVENWYVSSEPAMAVPAGDLPGFPNTWRVIRGSHSGGPTERFIAYVTGRGLIVTVHSTTEHPDDTAGRLIALITLGRHRVSVAEAGHGRFDARWECDGRSHCLGAAATTLAGFMSLVLHLAWI